MFSLGIFLIAQAVSNAPASEPAQKVAIQSTASVEILVATPISFEDLETLAKDSPAAVQYRQDAQGTIWIEFT